MTLPHKPMTLPTRIWQGHFLMWQIHILMWQRPTIFMTLPYFIMTLPPCGIMNDLLRGKVISKVGNVIFGCGKYIYFFMSLPPKKWTCHIYCMSLPTKKWPCHFFSKKKGLPFCFAPHILQSVACSFLSVARSYILEDLANSENVLATPFYDFATQIYVLATKNVAKSFFGVANTFSRCVRSFFITWTKLEKNVFATL